MEVARFSRIPWPDFEFLDTTTQARLIAYWECRTRLDDIIEHERAEEIRRQNRG